MKTDVKTFATEKVPLTYNSTFAFRSGGGGELPKAFCLTRQIFATLETGPNFCCPRLKSSQAHTPGNEPLSPKLY